MHAILDLDLDFFVWPPFRDKPEAARLPRSEWDKIASEVDVRSFLETQCHLSTKTPVAGYEAEEHEDGFKVWRQWLDDERIIAPFNIVHIDAHSDLGVGLGNRSYSFIAEELLSLPMEERRHPCFGENKLNSGNYLLGVIANRWIGHLTYVYPLDRNPSKFAELDDLFPNDSPPVNDLPAWIFRNNDWRTGIIELRAEPPVKLDLLKATEFSFAGFTHLFLASSPRYTPVEADELLPVIRQYFHLA